MSLLKRLKVKVRNARRSEEVLAHQRRAAGAGEGGRLSRLTPSQVLLRTCVAQLEGYPGDLGSCQLVTDLRILVDDVLLSAVITVICDLLPKHC